MTYGRFEIGDSAEGKFHERASVAEGMSNEMHRVGCVCHMKALHVVRGRKLKNLDHQQGTDDLRRGVSGPSQMARWGWCIYNNSASDTDSRVHVPRAVLRRPLSDDGE